MSEQTVAKENIQTTGQPHAFDLKSPPASVSISAGILVGTVALGDWLLWTDYPSLSLALFLAAIAIIHQFWHGSTISSRNRLLGFVVLFFGLVPLLEVLNFLTFLIATGGTFAACMIFRGNWPSGMSGKIDGVLSSCLLAVIRFPVFVGTLTTSGSGSSLGARLSGWLLPIVLAFGFVLLFQEANPLLQKWLLSFDLKALFDMVLSGRFLFWVFIAWCAWPYLERHAPVHQIISSTFNLFRFSTGVKEHGPRRPAVAFFTRCLVLFNLVFAVQTVMDVAYLWGEVTLPDGMSYAEFAHRGAYPLVVAALLAALFVIVAMRPGGAGEVSQTVKVLVLLWVAQNLMLVASSILRLDLYVAAYALTYWRLAAFIWMGLVMVGLVLIVVRFVAGKSSDWLVSANLLVLTVTLYATSLINIPGTIMSYNLRHLNEVKIVDWRYLRQLGGTAYPALVKFKSEKTDTEYDDHIYRKLRKLDYRLSRKVKKFGNENWRSWSFRWQRAYWSIDVNAMPTRPRPQTMPVVPAP